jgi:tetratricopeptide (TPR) repeat protein
MDDKGILQEWSAATRAPTELLDSTARYVHASISHNGEHLAGITSADELIVRNLTTGKQSHPRSVGSGDDLEIVIDNEGHRVAWASGDSSSPETVIFDVATGKEMSLHGAGWPKGFSPDGTQLVSCGLTPTISGASFFTKTWGVTSDPPELRHAFDHSVTRHGPANCAAFSPDATLLAIGTWDNIIRLRDAATGKLIHTLKGHTGEVLSVAFSPIGNMLVSGSADTTVRIWNADTGELRSTLSGHQDAVVSVAFSHDRHSDSPFSNSVASRSRAGTVKIWATATQADVEDNTDAWFERARYYYREHEPAEALVALMEVLKRKPRDRNALVFREKLLLQQGKDLLAIAVDDLPQSWEVRLSIAKLAAERQSWKRSAAIYLAAAKAGTDVSGFWLAGAAVLVKSGDLNGYQAYCHKMLERFEGKSTSIATAIVVDACLFVPPDESIRKASLEMADRLATLQATIPWQMRYVEMVQGMAEYRRGNSEEAVDWCRKCLAAKQTLWFSTVQAHLVLAMARAQLGEFGKAQQALKNGSEILSDKNKQFQADGFGDFSNWIICNTLLAEAEGEVQRAGR